MSDPNWMWLGSPITTDYFIREPCFDFSIIVNDMIGEVITHTKKWKRKGIGRLPKVKVKILGRKPAYYQMGNKIIVNPEGLKILRQYNDSFASPT